MSVKKEASGRPFIQVEVEVPGTPEEVWQAIATGPGISSWFVPAEFEEQDGKPVAVKLNFGPGMEPRSAVTAWDSAPMFATEADGWIPGRRPSRTSGPSKRAGEASASSALCKAFRQHGRLGQPAEGAKSGLASFLSILRIYLTHFRGQRSAIMKWMVPVAGNGSGGLGIADRGIGSERLERRAALHGARGCPGVPRRGGVRHPESVRRPTAARQAGPGVAALGAVNFGGQSMVALNFYLYGDQATGTVAHETPLWQAWFQQRFPMPTEPGKSD